MPRFDCGPTIQTRTRRFLEALLTYANCDLGSNNFDTKSPIKIVWKDRESACPQLQIETKLRYLVELAANHSSAGKPITKQHIWEAIKRLEDFLEILQDNRLQTQGKEEWRFTLTLWSRDVEENLKQFDLEWQKRRLRRKAAQQENLEERRRLQAIALEEQALVFNNRGIDEYNDQQIPDALVYFEEALEHHARLPEAHYNLGCVYEKRRMFDRARSAYEQAMLGAFPPAYSNIARLYITRDRDYAGAVDLLKEGMKLLAEEDKLDVRYALLKNLGWARLKQDRYVEAKAALQDAIALDNQRAAAHCLLAQVLDAKGDSAAARIEWQQCLDCACPKEHLDEGETKWQQCLDCACPKEHLDEDEDEWVAIARSRLTDFADSS